MGVHKTFECVIKKKLFIKLYPLTKNGNELDQDSAFLNYTIL